MRRILLVLLLVALSGGSFATETPAQFMERYVGYSNIVHKSLSSCTIGTSQCHSCYRGTC